MKVNQSSVVLYTLLILMLVGCASANSPKPTATSQVVVLPTKTVVAGPTAVFTQTETALPLPTVQANCTDSALYDSDVTIPDNTKVDAGKAFTKTWRLRNTGICIWNQRYALVFVGGDRMGAAIITPLAETPPGQTLDVSVALVAPVKDGLYTGLFELRNPFAHAVSIGQVSSIWVKIMVGNIQILPIVVATPGSLASQPGSSVPTALPTGPCKPQFNIGYIAQIANLINNARKGDGLAVLRVNDQISAAAQAHSTDMACNNFASHTGSDGSTIHVRIAAAGYIPSHSVEIIFPGGSPLVAFNWWINDKVHRDAILDPTVVDMGVGYTYLPGSTYGSYFTVDFAAP